MSSGTRGRSISPRIAPSGSAHSPKRKRGPVYWALSSLMVAGERITTKFAGLVMAAVTEASYLASQQVDEARHMQFYGRFQDEVIAEPGTIAAHVARSREQLGDSFTVIFDQALVSARERLAAKPPIRSRRSTS